MEKYTRQGKSRTGEEKKDMLRKQWKNIQDREKEGEVKREGKWKNIQDREEEEQ